MAALNARPVNPPRRQVDRGNAPHRLADEDLRRHRTVDLDADERQGQLHAFFGNAQLELARDDAAFLPLEVGPASH